MPISKGSKWGSKLKKVQSGWSESEEQYESMFGASDLPEDTYILKLQDCGLGESDAGNLYVKREHVILEGEHKGVVVPDRLMLSTENGPVFCRRWLTMMGASIPKKVEGLEKVLVELKEEAPIVKARVSHSGDYTNVRVVSVIGDDEDEGEGEGVDLDEMTLKELRALVKDEDLEIKGYMKMSEDELREAIAATEDGGDGNDEGGEEEEEEGEPDAGEEGATGNDEEEEGEGEEIDLDEMSKEDMLEFIEENEISHTDLGYPKVTRMKRAKEELLRKKLQAFIDAQSEEEEGEGGEGNDELLEQAKIFCGTWEVDIEDDSDLEDIKEAFGECEFPESELDEDEVSMLTALGCESCIQKPKPKAPRKAPAKKAPAKTATKAAKKTVRRARK